MALRYLLLLFVLNGADSSRIVGGRDAAPHSRPYMASVQFRGRHFCGGALVREDFVLTAAHCETLEYVFIVLGVDSLSSNEATKQQFIVVRVFPHPKYDGTNNDLMLLKLNRRAQLSEAVQVISLKPGKLKSVSQCITAGWGDIGDNNTLPNRLQEVNVTTLPQRTCEKRWEPLSVASSMVCGVGDHRLQGFCTGDSGGPLVCDGAAAGVISFSGRRCGDPSKPDVYMRISSFRAWIQNVLKNN
uniref:Peptidase S1 domain-containing protein n=1 Tax=Amphilophus citrinellus TaxID=61819 RepID=A0A3Q0S5E0_AMPCI